MEQSKFYQIKNITEQEYTLVGCDGSVITRPIQDVDKSASALKKIVDEKQIKKNLQDNSFRRMFEQKPAWSEEDKKVIHCLEYTIKHFYEDEDTIKWCCNWLKSLRPQNRWKPSDEQMKALKEACDEHWEPDGLDPLYTLYQDLKKIREE